MTINAMAKIPFTQLHLHTPNGSLLDGFCRIDPMIQLAKSFGMDSIGVSDHGTVFAHFQFYKKMKEAGLHPVLGMEGYICSKKEWKKADFEKIQYSDVAYRTKVEIESLAEQGYVAFTSKKQKDAYKMDSFTFGKPTKPEHHEFLRDLKNIDPPFYDSLKKSHRWYLSGKVHDKQKRLFESSPRIAHLLMIAKNNEGYSNLLTLATIGATEGMYSNKQRVEYNDIKKYGKGIIATSSCLGGTIPQLIRKGKLRVARNHIKFYQRCFDEFYLEIQPSTMPEQQLVNKVLMEWSKELGVPLVATSDAHMLRPEDRPVHKAITTINKNKEEDESEQDVYEHCIFYSAEEMLELGMPAEALYNAYKIAHSCHVELDMGDVKYPEFEVPEGFDFDSYLKELAYKGLFERMYQGNLDGRNFFTLYRTYKERLDYELFVLAKKKISAYMLIVCDYISWARSEGILVGPGRGSAAGSLVAYLLGITNLDPIRHDLLFERFTNPERPGSPDIDSDFDYLRRHEVLEYVTNKYGADRVSQIITFGTLSTKSALKDIGRALGIDHNEINEMNKHVPVEEGKPWSISKVLEYLPIFQTFQEKYPRLFELALEVEGMPRSSSTHACGVVISPVPIVSSIALVRDKKKGDLVAGYDGPTIEEMGWLKFDFLGLKNLSVVEICRRLREKLHGYLIDVDNLEPDDEKTFEMIRRGETDGVFQIESAGMKKLFQGMNKVDFETLIAGVALYRPGPMEYVPKYQALANGHEEIELLHPKYDMITRKTFGIMIYQEQVMQVAQIMAGYSAGEADTLRKAVGKKKKEILEPALEELYRRLVEHGIPSHIAKKICDDIRPFAGYAFNRSHAAAYAFLAYQTAYLKANYPLEFMTALLQVFYSDKDKVVRYARVAKSMGMDVLLPDINHSEIGFTIDGDNTIRYGLGAINGLGEATIQLILNERKSRFTNIEDLLHRIPKINKGSLAALTFSGAFDSFLPGMFNNRFELMGHIHTLRGEKIDEDLAKNIAKYNERLKFEKERELLGSYVSGHVLSRYAEPTNWEELDDATHFTMVSLVEAKVIRTKKGQDMAFLKVDTLEGEQDLTLFPNKYEAIKAALVPGMILQVGIKGEMNWQRNEKSFIVHSITAPKKINKEIWDKIVKKQEDDFMQGA